MSEDDYRYWAFVSYSHRDRQWGEWLQRSIETWRVPRRLVGRPGATGPAPRRLFPVFRDLDELPSSPNLNEAIDTALRQSRYLIVIASPYSAVSRWVEQEIVRFRALGRGDRILCLIVDGEPNAAGHGQLECLPPSLRTGGGTEPIAADVRPGQDGRALARSKLLAGLLGVGLDELRRRETRRRRLRIAGGIVAASLLAVAMAAGIRALHREAAAELSRQALAARVEALYENGHQELLNHNEARAAVFLAAAYRLGRDTPALRFQLARAMNVVEAQRFSFDTGAPLAGLRFSPDGTRLLAIGTGNAATVWDVAIGRQRFSIALPAPAWPVGRFNLAGDRIGLYPKSGERGRLLVVDAGTGATLADLPLQSATERAPNLFDRSGRRLIYLDRDGAAVIAGTDDGRTLLRIPGPFTFATFDGAGMALFTGDARGQVTIRTTDSGKPLRSFSGLEQSIDYIDTSADARLIAAGSIGGAFRLWDTATGTVRLGAAHAARYIGHAFNLLDGSRLLTASTDSARVWDTGSGALLYAMKFSNNGERIHISEDGRRLINTGGDRLSVFDIDSGTELYSLDGQSGGVADLDFSRDNRRLATAGRDGHIVVWQLPALPRAEFRHGRGNGGRADPAATVARTSAGFSAEGHWLFSAGADGRVVLRDAQTLETTAEFVADPAGVTDGAFSPDGSLIATGGPAGVALWSVPRGEAVRRFGGADKPLRVLRFAPDGQTLLGVYRGNLGRLWNVADGHLIAEWRQDGASAAAFVPGPGSLASGENGAVVLRRAGDGHEVWRQDFAGDGGGEITALDAAADGSRLVATRESGAIDVLATADGSVQVRDRDAASERIIGAQLDPEGRRVALGDWNTCATVQVPGRGAGLRLCGHGSQVPTVRFDPSGAFVATASGDGTAKLWDAADGRLLAPLAFHEGRIDYRGLVFDADGSHVLTLSEDGSARLWDSSLERRSPAAIDALLACLVPWKLDDSALVPTVPEPARCRGSQS